MGNAQSERRNSQDPGAEPGDDSSNRIHYKAKARKGTLGSLLQEASGVDGVAGAADALARSVHTSDSAPFAVVHAGEGRPAYRSDLAPDDTSIRYRDYSAPPLWATGVSILRVQVEPKTDPGYLFHSGEEVLTAVTGGVRYRFARSAPGGIDFTEADVHSGDIIRVNPRIPHHAEAIDVASSEKATVWMCMRAGSDSPYRLTATDNGYVPAKPFAPPRKLDPVTELTDAAKYACIATGLSESIRVNRQRADLTLDQVAQVCGVDAALISRIENASQSKDAGINISVDGLVRIAAYLGIPLAQLIWQAVQLPFEKSALPNPSVSGNPEMAAVPGGGWIDHDLHCAALNVPICRDAALPAPCRFEFGTVASWIVLDGIISVTLKTKDPYAKPLEGESHTPSRGRVKEHPEPLTLTQGSVLHFRHAKPVRVSAAQAPARVLQIVHGGVCGCDAGATSS